MTAVIFSITDLETGRWLGRAVICVKARYASIQWRGANRIERRFGSPKQWRSVDADLAPGFEVGLLRAIELPRYELAENHGNVFRLGQNAMAND